MPRTSNWSREKQKRWNIKYVSHTASEKYAITFVGGQWQQVEGENFWQALWGDNKPQYK